MSMIEEHRKKKALASIRETLSSFGYDITDLSDENIQEGCILFASAVSRCGVTMAEASELLAKAAQHAKAA